METPEERSDGLGYEDHHPTTPTQIRHSKNPRRFTDEQIKSLESIFKQDTKLEPRKKLQLAKDLGLQPRQIAIWFQNRRARWKSRQVEQEYKVLRASYDSLYVQFDDLKREKQSLQMQLQELSDAVKNLGKVDLTDRGADLKECLSRANIGMDPYNIRNADDDDDEEKFTNYFNKTEEKEPLRWGEEEEISQLGSPEAWCNLSSCYLFDHPSGTSNSNWWDN